MYDESSDAVSTEGWKLFMACADGSIFQNNAVEELCATCIDKGSKLYNVLSSYVTFPLMVPDRPIYSNEDVSRLVLPFLCGYGISNMYLKNHFRKNMRLISGSNRTFRFMQEFTVPFIVSSFYEHYVYEACELLDFPIENTYSTSLDLDYWEISTDERRRLLKLAEEISCMTPLDNLPSEYSCFNDLPNDVKDTLSRLDEIFENDILDFQSYRLFSSSTILSSKEKASALLDMRRKTGFALEDIIVLSSTQSDAVSSHIVKHGGGLSISFNGCPAALRASDIAIISNDTTIISFIADVFQSAGKEYVLDMVQNWSQDAILSSPANEYLKNALLSSSQNELPVVVKINDDLPTFEVRHNYWLHDQ